MAAQDLVHQLALLFHDECVATIDGPKDALHYAIPPKLLESRLRAAKVDGDIVNCIMKEVLETCPDTEKLITPHNLKLSKSFREICKHHDSQDSDVNGGDSSERGDFYQTTELRDEAKSLPGQEIAGIATHCSSGVVEDDSVETDQYPGTKSWDAEPETQEDKDKMKLVPKHIKNFVYELMDHFRGEYNRAMEDLIVFKSDTRKTIELELKELDEKKYRRETAIEEQLAENKAVLDKLTEIIQNTTGIFRQRLTEVETNMNDAFDEINSLKMNNLVLTINSKMTIMLLDSLMEVLNIHEIRFSAVEHMLRNIHQRTDNNTAVIPRNIHQRTDNNTAVIPLKMSEDIFVSEKADEDYNNGDRGKDSELDEVDYLEQDEIDPIRGRSLFDELLDAQKVEVEPAEVNAGFDLSRDLPFASATQGCSSIDIRETREQECCYSSPVVNLPFTSVNQNISACFVMSTGWSKFLLLRLGPKRRVLISFKYAEYARIRLLCSSTEAGHIFGRYTLAKQINFRIITSAEEKLLDGTVYVETPSSCVVDDHTGMTSERLFSAVERVDGSGMPELSIGVDHEFIVMQEVQHKIEIGVTTACSKHTFLNSPDPSVEETTSSLVKKKEHALTTDVSIAKISLRDTILPHMQYSGPGVAEVEIVAPVELFNGKHLKEIPPVLNIDNATVVECSDRRLLLDVNVDVSTTSVMSNIIPPLELPLSMINACNTESVLDEIDNSRINKAFSRQAVASTFVPGYETQTEAPALVLDGHVEVLDETLINASTKCSVCLMDSKGVAVKEVTSVQTPSTHTPTSSVQKMDVSLEIKSYTETDSAPIPSTHTPISAISASNFQKTRVSPRVLSMDKPLNILSTVDMQNTVLQIFTFFEVFSLAGLCAIFYVFLQNIFPLAMSFMSIFSIIPTVVSTFCALVTSESKRPSQKLWCRVRFSISWKDWIYPFFLVGGLVVSLYITFTLVVWVRTFYEEEISDGNVFDFHEGFYTTYRRPYFAEIFGYD